MALDRTGDDSPEHNCRNGWLTPPDSDAPQLCPCRLDKRPQPDNREPVVSERARLAIQAAEREDR